MKGECEFGGFLWACAGGVQVRERAGGFAL